MATSPTRRARTAKYAALTGRLKRIDQLADGLARVQGGETPASRALADEIKRNANAVRRALMLWLGH
jgi:hypothetical protein